MCGVDFGELVLELMMGGQARRGVVSDRCQCVSIHAPRYRGANIARHVSIVTGMPVLIFTMDGGDGDLIQRLIACVGQIDALKLRCGKLSDKEWLHISYALGMLHEAPIYVSESEGLSTEQMSSMTKRFCRQYGGVPGLIVVDFIQLMAIRYASAKPAEAMFEICRSLKALAKELDIPILALSQLPRDSRATPRQTPDAE